MLKRVFFGSMTEILETLAVPPVYNSEVQRESPHDTTQSLTWQSLEIERPMDRRKNSFLAEDWWDFMGGMERFHVSFKGEAV